MASVWDTAMFGWIDGYIPIHKAGSEDFTAPPLIKRIVDTGKPLSPSAPMPPCSRWGDNEQK